MRTRRTVLWLVAALGLPLALAMPAVAGINGYNDGDAVVLTAREGFEQEQAHLSSDTDPAERLIEFARMRACEVASGHISTPANGDCAPNAGAIQELDCDGLTPLLDLFRRERATPSSPWGPWIHTAYRSCPQDVLPDFTAEDFRRLPLDAPGLTIQPSAPTVLINVPTITMADADDQLLTTDLLGYPVEVRATAGSYTWDYGDGSEPVTTTSPGKPYPNHDVHHTYTGAGTYRITLTATWTGQYRFAGATTWTPIDGSATTSTTSAPITVVTARSELVAEP